MCWACGQNCLEISESRKSLFEAPHEPRQGPWTYRNMIADLGISLAYFAGDNADFLSGLGVLNPSQIFGEELSEATMNFRDPN